MKYPLDVQCRGAWLNSLVIAGILIGACGCNTPFMAPSKSTATLIQDASRKLASELAENLPTNQRWRIAIKPLEILPSGEATGKTSAISQALQESLINKLFLTKRFDVTVVGTDMRQKVENELRTQEGDERIVKETWGLSPERKERLSKLLGADAIVIGTITAFDSDYLVNCQLIPFKDNLVGSVGEAKIDKLAASSARNTGSQGSGGWGRAMDWLMTPASSSNPPSASGEYTTSGGFTPGYITIQGYGDPNGASARERQGSGSAAPNSSKGAPYYPNEPYPGYRKSNSAPNQPAGVINAPFYK